MAAQGLSGMQHVRARPAAAAARLAAPRHAAPLRLPPLRHPGCVTSLARKGLRGTSTRAAAAAAVQPAAPEQQQQQAQPAQQAAAPVATLAGLWDLLKEDSRQLAACAALTAFSVLCFVFVAPALGRVVDVISLGTGGTQRQLATAVGTLGLIYIGSNLTLAAQVTLALQLGESLAHRLRARLFGALLERDTLFYDSVKTGQMVAWLGQDIEVLQTTVAKLLGARGIRAGKWRRGTKWHLDMLRGAFETIGIIIMLFTLSPLLAATLLVTAPLLTPVIGYLGKKIQRASRTAQAASNDAAAAAGEIVENMRVVQLFGQQRREAERFGALTLAARAGALRVIRLQGWLDVSSRARNTLCVLATLALGSYLALNGRVSLGTCYSFFVYSFSFSFALSNLTNAVGDLTRASGAVSRAAQALEAATGSSSISAAAAASSSSDGTGAHPASSSAEAGSAAQQAAAPGGRQLAGLRGDIEFQGVSFRHPGGWGLEGASFSMRAGETVALVGPSGGGKSTLAGLLMGLYQPTEGEILVDGVPLAQLDLHWWRQQLGVVTQEPGLLSGRIGDIIRYGAPDATQQEVEWAARAAAAHEFVAALPGGGYAAEVGAGTGAELSGGQRQRLAIARALLRRPRVLILDEATSALDVETERSVTQALRTAGGGASCLVIAHRLSTVRRADRIVVVAAGRVVEQGTHFQLLGVQGGVYRRLVATAERRGQDSWDLPSSSDEDDSSPREAAAGSLALA